MTVSLNAAATIDDALLSVALQETPFCFEHICVDGGSRDATRAIIDRRAAEWSHIRRIYEPDRGIFDAMNKGLGAAVGDYVLYLNADDFLVSATTLATALGGVWSGADEPDLIAGDAVMGTPGRLVLWRHRRVPRVLGRIRGVGFFPVHQGLFVKRSLLLAVGGFDAGQRLGADVTLFYDLECRFRPAVQLLGRNVVFMRAGGAANAGLNAMYRGTVEIFHHVARTRGRLRAAITVAVKTAQSLSELRIGHCSGVRWFARAAP